MNRVQKLRTLRSVSQTDVIKEQTTEEKEKRRKAEQRLADRAKVEKQSKSRKAAHTAKRRMTWQSTL